MFCEKCGAQLPDDAKFCEKCGSSTVPGAAAAPAAAAVAAAAVAPAAPKEPSAFSLALKKFFSNKRNVIITVVALLLVIAVIVAIIIIASQPKKIYIDDYFHVVFEGVDGTGHAYISATDEENEAFAKLNKKLFGDDFDEEGEHLGKYISVSLDMTEEELHSLKNGDKIKIKLKVNKELYDEIDGYKVVLRNKTVKVTGLYKSTQLNVLDYIIPSFSGFDGFGKPLTDGSTKVFTLINGLEARVTFDYSSYMQIEFYDTAKDLYLASVYAYYDSYEKLANGDKVNVSLNASDYSTDSLYSGYGIILSSQTKEYTVSGLTEPNKLDIASYIKTTFEGVSTVATMQFTVPTEEITVGSYTVAFTKYNSSYSREFYIDILNENGSSIRTVNYYCNNFENLKNGDKVVFKTYASTETIVNEYGIALPETFEFEVTGLSEPFNADPLGRGTYSFAGYDGYGSFVYAIESDKCLYTTDDGKYTIKLSLSETEWYYKLTVVVADENGRNFISFYYEAYKGDSLRNGDTVYFNCSTWSDTLKDYVKEYGIYFPHEVTYTVEGLAETTKVQPLNNVTFAFSKSGDSINMTLGLKENLITVGDSTVALSLEKYTSWGTEYTKINMTIKDKDGNTVATGYYQFQTSDLYEGQTVYAQHSFPDYTITKATGIVFDTDSFSVIVSSM